MGLGKKDIFVSAKTSKKEEKKPKKQDVEPIKVKSYHLKTSLIKKVRSYAFWEGLKISEVVNLALEEFFKGKRVILPKK